jgi:hypothetical protein
MEQQRRQNRDDRNGRYTFDGHTLGHHAGAATHDCMAGSGLNNDPLPTGQHCACQKFRPAKSPS